MFSPLACIVNEATDSEDDDEVIEVTSGVGLNSDIDKGAGSSGYSSTKDVTDNVADDKTDSVLESTTSAFLAVDYTNTTQHIDQLSLENQPECKVYRCKRKRGDQAVSMVRVYQSQLGNIFRSVTQALDINSKDQKRLTFTYPLRTTNGPEEYITVRAWDANLTETLELFYCQTENQSLLLVDITSKRAGRPLCRTEKKQEEDAENIDNR